MTQQPDTQPGAYYVTAADVVSNAGHVGAVYLMLGPFPNDHAAALACVEAVQRICNELDGTGKAWFLSYGTARYPVGFNKPGRLNVHFGLPQ